MKFYRIVNITLIILAVIGGSFSDFLDCKDCGGVFTAHQSIVTSPKYPENYPAKVCCDYLLRSPYRCATNFHIQFLDFSLESSLNCENDFLAIGEDTDVDVRNYTGDILCGRVIGIKNYRSRNGILKLRLVTNDVNEDRGFRLLITRLSCEETMTHNTTNKPAHKGENFQRPVVTQLLPPFEGTHTRPNVTNLTKQTNNHQEDVFRSEQYLPPPPSEGYLPNNPSYPPPFYPQPSTPLTPNNNGYLPPPGYPCPTPPSPPSPPLWFQGNNYNPENNNYPQQQQPSGSCCAVNFRQQHFYLTSPGFPARITDTSPPRDCFYYIEKSGPNVCRLRVAFRYFALGSLDTYSGQCLSDFIEIDGERMCGCRTGFVYTTREWGLGAKVIRLKTNGRLSGTASIGFILDVTQEICDVRYSRQVVGDDIDPEKLIPHAIVETNSTSRAKIYLHDSRAEQLGYSSKNAMNSKLFFAQTNPCEFGFADLLRISFEPLWVTRIRC